MAEPVTYAAVQRVPFNLSGSQNIVGRLDVVPSQRLLIQRFRPDLGPSPRAIAFE